jgi:hypothetical protein
VRIRKNISKNVLQIKTWDALSRDRPMMKKLAFKVNFTILNRKSTQLAPRLL